MLEEVRETGAPLRLAADADVIDDRDTDHGCAAVRRQHHPQAVVEREPLDRIFRRRDLYSAGHRAEVSAPRAERDRQTTRIPASASVATQSHWVWVPGIET
ncbi:hypothetical protein Afe04nite_83320 [Asanoa ferruginea]|nr:hypothetical protein Afe04nite_83320 [Asanoa ferruginea]